MSTLIKRTHDGTLYSEEEYKLELEWDVKNAEHIWRLNQRYRHVHENGFTRKY